MPASNNNDPRPFTLVKDAYPEGKGAAELENSFSYSHRTRDEHGFNALEIEHEFEFGLADNFDLKIPIAYRYEDSEETQGLHFDSAAIQGDLYLTSPYTDPLGVAIMAEVGVGEHTLAFETTLVLQKDFGPWVVAYNLGAETEIEGVFQHGAENEVTGVLVNALGAAYTVTPSIRVGGQISAESEYADWNHHERTTVYAGPTFSYFGDSNWWLTAGPNFLLSNQDDEPQFRADVIFTFSF